MRAITPRNYLSIDAAQGIELRDIIGGMNKEEKLTKDNHACKEERKEHCRKTEKSKKRERERS